MTLLNSTHATDISHLIGYGHPESIATASTQASKKKRPSLSVLIADSAEDILSAQRLRYQVFAEELGARLSSKRPGIDEDMFDAFCKHLIVRHDETGEVIGTYRILTPEKAKAIGTYYTDSEFDLTRLSSLKNRMVEIGRSCVHPSHRTGATISLLWAGLARFMTEHKYDYLIGCASISMADGGHHAASLYNNLKEDHLSPIEYRVFPRCALPLEALNLSLKTETPPLIKGYLRAGAYICGEPAWDPDFNTADLPILMPMAQVSGRYSRHYLQQSAT